MQFQLRTAQLIVFGKGELARAPELLAPFGRRLFLCTGRASLDARGLLKPLIDALAERGVAVTRFAISGEPEVAIVDEAVALCRQCEATGVLAIGGGSVLDVGKAVAALAAQESPGRALEYLEDVGRGAPRPIVQASLPFCAVPTTAGSGSEVTRNAVLRVPELSVKRSMRSDLMLPRIALLDPSLLHGAPRLVSATAGLDALTHLIEGYLSRGAQPTTDALAQRGLSIMGRALGRLAAQPDALSDETAQDLALASMWGGVVLANAGLGAVHGLVAPLGGLCAVAHGDGCACLLPATFRENYLALRRRAPQSPALVRYAEIAALLAENPALGLDAAVEAAAARLAGLRQDLGVPSLAEQGVSDAHFGRVIAQSRGSSMRFNPIELLDGELEAILRASL